MPVDEYPKVKWGDIKNHKKWRRADKLFDGKDGERCERLSMTHPYLEDNPDGMEFFIQVNGKNLDGKGNGGRDWFNIHDSVLLGHGIFVGLCCGIYDGVTIDSNVSIEKHGNIWSNVSIGSSCVIKEGVNIGENTTIENDVDIGMYVKVGSNTIIKTGCKIGAYCDVGSNVILRNQLTYLEGSNGKVFIYSPEKKEIGITNIVHKEIHTIKHWKKYYKKILRGRFFGFGEDQIVEYKRYIDLFDDILADRKYSRRYWEIDGTDKQQ